MLAVDTLLRQADSLLQSGYAAQTDQLPDSARADFRDASARANRAGRVFFLLGTAGPYQGIVDNLGHAMASYTSAAADGSAGRGRSPSEAATAQTFLTYAENALNVTPEASQSGALAAESTALSAVTPHPARHPRPVHHRTRHAARAHRSPSATAHHAHGSTPATLKTVISTVTPTATASPTQQPTSTPVPTPVPTATPQPRVSSHRARPIHRALDPRVVTALRSVSGQRADLLRAFATTSACRAKVLRVASGSDAAGSSSILACLTRSLSAVERLRLTGLARLPGLRFGRAPVTSAVGNVGLALSKLLKSESDLQAIDVPATETDLDAATSALRSARESLLTVERALKRIR